MKWRDDSDNLVKYFGEDIDSQEASSPADCLFLQGYALEHTGFLERAIRCYKLAQIIKNDNSHKMNTIARRLKLITDLKDKLEVVEKNYILAFKLGHDRACISLAKLMIKLNRWKSAEELLKHIAKYHPQSYNDHRPLVEQVNAAVRFLERWRDVAKDSLISTNLQGNIVQLMQENRVEDRMKNLRALYTRITSPSDPHYEELIKEERAFRNTVQTVRGMVYLRSNQPIHILLSSIRIKLEEFDEAFDSAIMAATTNPGREICYDRLCGSSSIKKTKEFYLEQISKDSVLNSFAYRALADMEDDENGKMQYLANSIFYNPQNSISFLLLARLVSTHNKDGIHNFRLSLDQSSVLNALVYLYMQRKKAQVISALSTLSQHGKELMPFAADLLGVLQTNGEYEF